MAQKIGRQGEWPTVRGNPTATFVTRDGYLKSGRSLAGPLRLGTAGPVGPRGAAPNGPSDFGLDHVEPAHGRFDPIGTSDSRAPPPPESGLVRGDS